MSKKFINQVILLPYFRQVCTALFLMLLFYGFFTSSTFAQTCYALRVINQHRCQSTIYTGCLEYTVPNTVYNCSGTGSSPAIANTSCQTNCLPNGSTCDQSLAYCSQYLPFLNQCVVSDFLASCTAAPSCNVTANIVSCTQTGPNCTENTQNLTYECWANGPVSTPPTESGGCASGQCFTGIASCADVGQSNTGASCTGGVCCAPTSTYNPTCPYNGFQTDFPGDAPGADCRYSEGNGCNWKCTTWGSGCNGCADGLVGGGCLCPSCDVNFSPRNVTIAVGEKRDITIQNIPTSWRRHGVSYPLAPIVGDFDERYDLEYRFRHFENGDNVNRVNPPTVVDAKLRGNGNQIRLEGLAPGTSRIEVRTRYTGYSPRVLCSRFITVAVNATDVPCGDVTNFSLGPQNACDNSTVAGGQGNLQARWTEVPDADQYELILTGATVGQLAPFYISSSLAGCNTATEDEVCQFSIPGLVKDTYTGSIRAASTTNLCQQQTTYATSPPFDVTYCPGTVTAIGKSVASAGLSCAAIIASTNSSNVNFTLSGSSTYNQNGNNVTFNPIEPGTWAISSTAPPGNTSVGPVCWARGAASGSGNSASVGSYENLTFYLPFAAGNPWQQVSGGDAIICRDINSPVGVNANPRQFMKKPVNGAPGIVGYGNSYDFDPAAGNGANLVSESNWLVQESPSSMCNQNWYDYFFNKFGLLGVSPDLSGGTHAQNQFPSRTQPYVVSGDMITQGAWSIPQGNSVVIFVNGNLTINGNITLVGKSFLGFIVSGNITVDPAVTNMDGVFINNGTFDSGTGANQLTVNGTVIAGNIDLGRDMGANNDTTPGEVFNYSPKLLFSMPTEFMGMDITWNEVAP